MNGELFYLTDSEALGRFLIFLWQVISSPLFLILVIGFFSVLLWTLLKNLDSKT